MGTIRNKVTLVHHWDIDKITKLREDAIKTFNGVIEPFDIDIVGPIMTSPCNSGYTFMIQGDCAINGWPTSEKFNDIRMGWCKKHMHDGANILVVNLGEDYPASIDFDSESRQLIINEFKKYAQHDINEVIRAKEKIKEYEKMKIENVIFNDPATIVFWRDGSKTVVKAIDEPYDPEKGLAMAIAKKAYGNEGNYYNEFKKFIKDDAKEENKNE